MSFLLRIIVVVGILWLIISYTDVFNSSGVKQKKAPVKQSEQVKIELERSVDQMQEKLDQAMQQSGGAQ
jgi:cell division protein YceG involved in septum cleavage